jgi:hypothetical protein
MQAIRLPELEVRLYFAGIARARLAAISLTAILLGALALRVYVIWTQTYVVYEDETFQYLEQAHRLAFGSGVVPWEFHDGIRSWLLPGLVAGVMRAADAIHPDPLFILRVVRLACAAFSLSVVVAGFLLVLRREENLPGAILAGILCAVCSELVYFAPTVLTEVIAGNCLLLGIVFCEIGDDERTARRLLIGGALFGLVVCLRYQYAPALLATAFWQNRLDWRRWAWLTAGGLAVVIPIAGGLDWLTWGAPFQSIWLNLARNSWQGVSAGMGVMPWDYYLQYLLATWQPAGPLLLVLAIIGATRLPAVALAAVVTLLVHSLLPHKEFRFIYLASAAVPILVGAGASALLTALTSRGGRLATASLLSFAVMLAAAESYAAATRGPLAHRWEWERDIMRSFLAAHDAPGMCGLGVLGVPFYETGGYAYLHRPVPLYFDDFTPLRTLKGAALTLRFSVMLQGRQLAEPPVGRMAQQADSFNYLIAPEGGGLPGYQPTECFGTASSAMCLYRRPGPCGG